MGCGQVGHEEAHAADGCYWQAHPGGLAGDGHHILRGYALRLAINGQRGYRSHIAGDELASGGKCKKLALDGH